MTGNSPWLAAAVSAVAMSGFGAIAWYLSDRCGRVRGLGRAAAAVIAAATAGLIVSELLDARVAEAWQRHPMATQVLGGLLLLAATVFLVDEVLQRRESQRWGPLAVHATREMSQAAASARV